MIVKAYAKINLDLEILGKRPDGYHELKTKMQSVPDLYDLLDITEADDIVISSSNKNLACDETNLCYKALELLGKKAHIYIEKNIPLAAGLAGGSADAAAVLYAFLGASSEAFELAKELGSDVPFSLFAIKKSGYAAAIAKGRGEELEEILPINNRIIVKTPNIQLSTKAVYEEYDRNPLSSFGGNDLEAPAIRLCPAIKDLIDELKNKKDVHGNLPIKVAQSGSGPSCFAIYEE